MLRLQLGVLASIVALSSVASAATYYVRPLGGAYGTEDGSSYTDAYNGMADLVATSAVVAGDAVYICGTMTETLHTWVAGTATKPITFRGDCPNESGRFAPSGGTGGSGAVIRVSTAYTQIRNLTIYVGKFGRGISVMGSQVAPTGVVVQDNVVIGNGDAEARFGIFMSSDVFEIRGNLITKVRSGISHLQPPSTIVSGLTTENQCHGLTDSVNGQCIMWSSSSDWLYRLRVSYNKAYGWGSGEECIDVAANSNVIVEHNYCDGLGVGGNGIKAGLAGGATGNIVRGNTIRNVVGYCLSDNGGTKAVFVGNVCDKANRGIVITAAGTIAVHNTIINIDVGVKRYAINVSSAVASTVANNILDGADADMYVNNAETVIAGGGNILTHNRRMLNGSKYTGDDLAGSAGLDRDYRPMSGSRARWAGKPVYGGHDNRGCQYDMAAPTIGAFEVCGDRTP